MRRSEAGLVALLLVLLAACATPTPPPGAAAWISGRLSVQVDASAGQRAQNMSAAFELRGTGQSGELRLNSPLGTRMAQARWAPGLAVLETKDGAQRYATLDELSRQALGEALPLAALPDWLAGRPWSVAPHEPTAEGFDQLGWQVQLARQAEGWIEARRASPPAVQVRVRLDDRGVP